MLKNVKRAVKSKLILLKNNKKLFIDAQVILGLFSFRQITKSADESGGILIGSIKTTGDIIIRGYSSPQRKDKATRTSYKKNKQQHQQILDKYWETSGGYINYLGDWHTHPEKFPRPSHIDLKSWKHILSDNLNDEFYACIFMIVGIEELCIWLGEKRSKKLYEIKKIKI